MFKAVIKVMLKKGVLDPQGEAVQSSLSAMGYDEVKDVRIGKYMTLELDNESKNEAEKNVEEMCKRLLANPVIEDYEYEIVEVST
ncbi:phosphoribosylformylglycinamidine synthase subunit PurS [Natranaerofaba carboxydovora]|uniref:phosphoribosylformylglycinamidine synthase subunit PurS n=1 Tax=Natranaerofaba carboxydovora TaxID=2742683 RepID=UPI001F1397D5|nr:phosphoribosylformylglycinamidine synthase subunit PurS [Natranaerofaba carboxydovora]UMZ74542.1 Phosphoribosylformylglycinamidine synthase subunit PurS [Natranaerofaba carboxydovora]